MNRLAKKIADYVTVNGNKGRSQLAIAAERSEQMIDRYIKGQSIPSAQTRYRLAIACGATHDEALEWAQESPDRQGKAF